VFGKYTKKIAHYAFGNIIKLLCVDFLRAEFSLLREGADLEMWCIRVPIGNAGSYGVERPGLGTEK
jgi:hypothetical protein